MTGTEMVSGPTFSRKRGQRGSYFYKAVGISHRPLKQWLAISGPGLKGLGEAWIIY